MSIETETAADHAKTTHRAQVDAIFELWLDGNISVARRDAETERLNKRLDDALAAPAPVLQPSAHVATGRSLLARLQRLRLLPHRRAP